MTFPKNTDDFFMNENETHKPFVIHINTIDGSVVKRDLTPEEIEEINSPDADLKPFKNRNNKPRIRSVWTNDKGQTITVMDFSGELAWIKDSLHPNNYFIYPSDFWDKIEKEGFKFQGCNT